MKEYIKKCKKCKKEVIKYSSKATKVLCKECREKANRQYYLKELDNSLEGIEFVTCKICNRRLRRLIPDHLKKIHNITKEKYLELFPNSLLYCKSVIENLRKEWFKTIDHKQKSSLKSRQTNEFHKLRSEISKKILTEEMKQRISKKVSETLLNRSDKEFKEWFDKFTETVEKNKNNIYKRGTFVTKDGRKFHFRSSFEETFMIWLDKTYFTWDFEPSIRKVLIDNKIRRHLYDFYIKDLDVKINLKGRKDQAKKEIEFMKQNKNEKIFLFFKEELSEILKLDPSNKCECLKILKIGQSAAERIISGSTTIRKE